MWQTILGGLGGVLSFFYDVVPNYGIAIILLTLAIRVAVLPLTLKGTRAMHAMQALQPQIKELQRKYKGDRQKLNEEMMKLYKQHDAHPLGGCLPLLLQAIPMTALFSVVRGDPNQVPKGVPGSIAHLPGGSELAAAIKTNSANFLTMNLECSPSMAGSVERAGGLACGSDLAAAAPFYILIALLVVTQFLQQRQMTQLSGQQQGGQAQAMMRAMPVVMGFIGWISPAGVVLYLITYNIWQMGQQHFMLKSRAKSQVEGSAPARPAAVPPKSSAKSPAKGKGGSARPAGVPPKSSGGKKNAGSRKKRRKR